MNYSDSPVILSAAKDLKILRCAQDDRGQWRDDNGQWRDDRGQWCDDRGQWCDDRTIVL